MRNADGSAVGEGKQIEHLLKSLTHETATYVLGLLTQPVDYFSKRRPIERMDKREVRHPTAGSDREGTMWRKQLREAENPVDKVSALSQILYLVRSNLVHGSKAQSGDDAKIITISGPALKKLLELTINSTRRRFFPAHF